MAMNEHDISLVTSAKDGNTQAFEELYDRYYGKIFALARMTVKNEADAEDILQQAFISAWRNMNGLTSPEAFSTWLQKITLNHCYSLLRRKNITILMDAESETEDFSEEISDEFLPAVYAERDDLRSRLGKILDSLSEVQKQTIVLYYFNEQKVEEIAYIMECNVGTVKSRLFLARKAIRAEVEEEERKSGEKFYGIAGIPMLSLGELVSQYVNSQALSGEISSGVLAALSETISGEAVGSATASEATSALYAGTTEATNAAATSSTTATAAASAGTAVAATTAGLSVGLKVLIIVATAVICIMVGFGGMYIADNIGDLFADDSAPTDNGDTPHTNEPITTPNPEPTPTPTPTPELTPEDEKQLSAYDAYYEIIKAKVDELGFGYASRDSVFGRGVLFAGLFDFDNDGFPELLIIFDTPSEYQQGYFDTAYEIYGFTDNLILHNRDTVPTISVPVLLSIETNRNGILYFARLFADAEYLGGFYSTVTNNGWEQVFSYDRIPEYDPYEAFFIDGEGEYSSFINGALVSDSEYNSKVEAWENEIVSSFQIFEWHAGPSQEMYDTVPKLLDELLRRNKS